MPHGLRPAVESEDVLPGEAGGGGDPAEGEDYHREDIGDDGGESTFEVDDAEDNPEVRKSVEAPRCGEVWAHALKPMPPPPSIDRRDAPDSKIHDQKCEERNDAVDPNGNRHLEHHEWI